ncbi:transposase IstA protein [Mycobacterium intracellulare subsp. chimaera]|uniref:Uncharacterized protein n=2 Tax=Mycobacterium avium complex (MAC) TaxID=120793 RepID=A0AAI8SLA4_MYCAV|nr:transposase IstA protein [Mycobacterium intracellulare subsp. chimaera]ASL22268.1 transposase IstA protein [Mycobacterium intracellulare subsp. chimaera]BBN47260.1 hypothetical protein JPH1_17350 [Mycobacterium avium subsp. hominissuis]BCP06006.1 hypothetical protein MINTM019_34620 [Mycobacterium paraintracellulare]
MATLCDPGNGRVTAAFARAAKHYGEPWRSARRALVIRRPLRPDTLWPMAVYTSLLQSRT